MQSKEENEIIYEFHNPNEEKEMCEFLLSFCADIIEKRREKREV